MGNRYVLKNGLAVFMSKTTRDTISDVEVDGKKEVHDVLRRPSPTIARCQALLDFRYFTKAHTRENIGR